MAIFNMHVEKKCVKKKEKKPNSTFIINYVNVCRQCSRYNIEKCQH